jgi:hypothetical protein
MVRLLWALGAAYLGIAVATAVVYVLGEAILDSMIAFVGTLVVLGG